MVGIDRRVGVYGRDCRFGMVEMVEMEEMVEMVELDEMIDMV